MSLGADGGDADPLIPAQDDKVKGAEEVMAARFTVPVNREG